ncbi:MAG: host specificity factor TipJ family phage tail protein [Candidatus ainarchaeum sp.]|nr:host specificity factor TipJ family phage tail protein [Candidatus ainarchaeum sp.]
MPRRWIELEQGSTNYADHLEGDVVNKEEWDIHLDPSDWVSKTSIWRWIPLGTKYTTQEIYQYSLTGSSSQLLTRTFLLPNLPRGKYDIRITRLAANTNNTRYGDQVQCSKITEVYYDDFRYPRMALVGIKSLATEEISGSLQFSCLVEGLLIRVYNSVTETWSVIYSNNPAWVCYDILTQPVFNDDLTVNRYDGYNPSYIDYLKFSEWADWCDTLVAGEEKRITFNGVFDSQFDTWTAAWKVAETGRAALVWNGTTITVVVDKETTESQLFTIGNIGIDSFKESFLSDDERAGEIEVDFINSERDYERDKYTLVSSEINKPNNKSTLQLMGITKTSEAWRAAKFKLLCNQYLTRTIEFNVDIDAIACTVGDVVRVGHSIPQWGFGGRVVSATSTTVTLDQEVTLEAAKNYEICIRLADDTIVEKSIALPAGSYSTLTIGGSFSTIPAQYDIFTFGEVNISYKPFRIVKMTKSGDQQVSIIAVEYDANIYTGDTNSPTVPTINYSALDPYVHVTEINLRTEASTDSSDALRVKILINWRTGTNTIYGGAAIYLREKLTDGTFGRWTTQKFVRNTLFATIENVAIGKTYEIGINCWNFVNTPSPSSELKTKQITVLDEPRFYSEYLKRRVSGISIKDHPNEDEFDGQNCTITWNAISSVDNSIGAGNEELGAGYRGPNKWFKDYEVSVYSTGGILLSQHYTTDIFFTYTLTQNSLDNDGVPVSSFAFEVKARTRLLTVSESATRLTVTNTAPAAVGIITSESYEDGVTFSWPNNTENDLRGYLVRTAFASGSWTSYYAWSDWFETPKNIYFRDLTTTEKELQGWGNANIQIEIKSIDVFGNSSVLVATKVEQCRNQKIDITVGPTSVLGTFTDLISAIDSLPSGGGKIYIKNGTYDCALIILPNKHLDIEGQTKSGVIIRNTAGLDLFKLLDVSTGFTFKNFTIQSVNTSSFSKMFDIQGTVVANNIADVEFENIVFNLKDENLLTTGDIGVYCYKTQNNSYSIKSCEFNEGRYGFLGETIYPYKLLFSTNLCIKQKNASVYGNALELEIFNNIIKDIMYKGFDFIPSTIPVILSAKIAGNSLTGFSGSLLSTWAAISVQSAKGEISRNSITLDTNDVSNGVFGIYLMPSSTGEYTVANNPIDLKTALIVGSVSGIYHGGNNSVLTSNPIKINAASATYRNGISVNYISLLGGGGQNNTINDNPINMVNSGAADIGIVLNSSTNNNSGFNAIQNAGVKVRNLGGTGNKINKLSGGSW